MDQEVLKCSSFQDLTLTKKSLENNLRLKFSDGLPFCHWIVLQFLHKLAFTTECQEFDRPFKISVQGNFFPLAYMDSN